MHVTAPASSANLGPGFDTLGLALDLPFELIEGQTASGGASGPASGGASGLASGGASGGASRSAPVDVPPGFLLAEQGHPACRAYVAAGGAPERELWWRSPIPPGRGLGFSGAARVAGAYLALLGSGSELDGAFRIAAGLEGHPDNAAASTFGGLTVAAGGAAVRVRGPEGLVERLRLVTWSPAEGTSTDSSRSHLEEGVPLPIAISSIGRASLWVAAIASGRLDLLRQACLDELHQPARLAARPDAAAVLRACLDSEQVLAAWLSGSGPTVAALLGSEQDASRLAEQLTAGSPVDHQDRSRVRVLKIDVKGVHQVIPD
ncbi:MAG: hypothetical protein WBA45_15930 [Microthrixaceae bacterium]